MNALAKLSTMGLLLLTGITGRSGQSEPVRFYLTIKVEKDSVRVGSIVNLQVTITNRSSRTVSVHEGGVLEDWVLDVRGSDGTIVPDTGLARKIKAATKGAHQRNFIARLKPGESREDTIEVSAFRDMSQPGEYKIRVQRQLPPELGTGIVTSNTIVVTVTP